MSHGDEDDDTYAIIFDTDKDLPSSSSKNRKIRNTIKTKYQKTKANLQSVCILPEKKDRNDYEDLDKNNQSTKDLNFVEKSSRIEDTTTTNNRQDKFKGQANDIDHDQLKNVPHYGDNQSKINLTSSSSAAAPFYQTTAQTPATMVVGDRGRLRKGHVWFIFLVFLYSMYLIFGSLCFSAIESPAERNATINIREMKSTFRQKYPQINEDDLEEFLKAIITANDRGISPLRNASNDLNWSFGQALFFSSTVVTTIGYGHVTPLSQTGKIFCMIYATIGIPLTLILLSAVIERLLIPANWLLGLLNSKLGHLYQPFNIRLLHLSIIVALIATIFFAIPTTIFAYLEPNWGALDAFYYCFISLTTIGLGDYIPGDGVSAENRSLYKICITGYLVCGLIAMMFTLTVFYDIPQLNLGQLFTENLNGETEKLRLSGNNTTCYSGPSGLYMPQRDEEVRRAVVRIRPHGDDSPSPDDPPSSLNRDMRIP